MHKIKVITRLNSAIMFLMNKTEIRESIMINLFENAYIFYEWPRMSDPRTGGVTEPPRKMKKNGVKNLNGAQATPEFYSPRLNKR